MARPLSARTITSTAICLVFGAQLVGCGSQGRESSAGNSEQGVSESSEQPGAPEQVVRTFDTVLPGSPAGSAAGGHGSTSQGNALGALEPACVAAVRYIANIARTMDEAIREYGSVNGAMRADSQVSTSKPPTLMISVKTNIENLNTDTASGTTVPPSSSSTHTQQINTTITVGVDLNIPLGAEVVTTSVTALKSAEGSAFINTFFAQSDILSGVRANCSGLGLNPPPTPIQPSEDADSTGADK